MSVVLGKRQLAAVGSISKRRRITYSAPDDFNRYVEEIMENLNFKFPEPKEVCIPVYSFLKNNKKLSLNRMRLNENSNTKNIIECIFLFSNFV